MIALPSPTSATSVGTFWSICSGAMSSWMIRTSGLKRGGRPKCMIQFSRAPSSRTRSAFCSAWERAAPTDSGWSSGITPLPIGEARNGSRVRSMKARTSSSARDQAMPLPTMTSGRSAVRSASRARATSLRHGLGARRVRAARRLVHVASSTGRGSRRRACRGRSRRAGRTRRSAPPARRRTGCGRTCSTTWLYLQNGVATSTWRSSWNAPMPFWSDSEAPPMSIIGQLFCLALARPARAWITPGPDTTRQRLGRPVR